MAVGGGGGEPLPEAMSGVNRVGRVLLLGAVCLSAASGRLQGDLSQAASSRPQELDRPGASSHLQTASQDVSREITPCPECWVNLLDKLEGNFQIIPGLNISASPDSLGMSEPSAGNRTSGSGRVIAATERFLRSITLHLTVYNEPVIQLFRRAADQLLTEETGRSKKKRTRYQFLSVYTVFAVAFALMSALVGKALTISIVSLVVSLVLCRGLRNNDLNNQAANAPPPTVYDIVRRPQVQVQHSQTAEDVYEIPPASPGSSVSYVYTSPGTRSKKAALDPYTYASHQHHSLLQEESPPPLPAGGPTHSGPLSEQELSENH